MPAEQSRQTMAGAPKGPGWLYWVPVLALTAAAMAVCDPVQRPGLLIVPLVAGALSRLLVGVRRDVGVYGRTGRAHVPGVGWIDAADIQRVELDGERWRLDTVSGSVWLAPEVTGMGSLAALVRDRDAAPSGAANAPSATTVERWLRLRVGERHRLRSALSLMESMAMWLLGAFAVGLPLMPRSGAWNDILGMEALLGAFAAALVAARRYLLPLWCDAHGFAAWWIDFPNPVRWADLIAVRDDGRVLRLTTAKGDLTIVAADPHAAAVKHTAQQVLAALAANGGWAATPGDASLSPAERLTGEAERGLSQADAER